jgi:hypothetical protein
MKASSSCSSFSILEFYIKSHWKKTSTEWDNGAPLFTFFFIHLVLSCFLRPTSVVKALYKQLPICTLYIPYTFIISIAPNNNNNNGKLPSWSQCIPWTIKKFGLLISNIIILLFYNNTFKIHNIRESGVFLLLFLWARAHTNQPILLSWKWSSGS